MTQQPELALGVPLLPPRAQAEGTHRRVLQEALLRFADRGFHGVSVREIAQGAGIRASSIYGHLQSKEQLLFELVLLGHEEHHSLLRAAVLDADADPVDQIIRLVEAHVGFHARYSMLARVCNRELAALSAAHRQGVLTVRHHSEQLLLDVVTRGVRKGVFHVPDPWLAMAAVGAIGIRVAEWWDDGHGYTTGDVATSYSALVATMLTTAPAPGSSLHAGDTGAGPPTGHQAPTPNPAWKDR